MKKAFAFSTAIHLIAAAVVSLWLASGTALPDHQRLLDVDLLRVGRSSKAPAERVMPARRLVPAAAVDSLPVPMAQAAFSPATDDSSSVTIEADGTQRVLSPAEYVAWVRSHNQGPAYPRLANLRRQEGRAVVRVVVNQGGVLESVDLEASSGSELLDQAALEAVHDWQFPRFTGNDPRLLMKIPFKFLLDDH